MEPSELSDVEKDVFKHIVEGNFSEVKSLINDFKLSVNRYDKQGMTPLQHAAFKGHHDICKLLLDCGADVNDNKDVYGYSALSLAALSNHCDVVILLLERGANPSAVNANKRTAAQVAAFVGNHRPVGIINNFVPKDIIDYFTEIHGLETEPKLPLFLSELVHKLVIMPSIHPVRILLYLQSNSSIFQNLEKVIGVLNILAEKQLKEMSNDRLSLKLHHIAFVLLASHDYTSQNKKDAVQETISDHKVLDVLMKSWLKCSENASISVILENFLRKSVSAFPFRDCPLYQHVVTTISSTNLGKEPNALSILNNAILGQHSYYDCENCATCGDQSSTKLCTGCKKVHYCNKTCQKLHWFVHKSVCKK